MVGQRFQICPTQKEKEHAIFFRLRALEAAALTRKGPVVWACLPAASSETCKHVSQWALWVLWFSESLQAVRQFGLRVSAWVKVFLVRGSVFDVCALRRRIASFCICERFRAAARL